MSCTFQTLRVRRRAFTLVEMLVVIGIIGVLAALLLAALGPVRDVAHRAACANNLRQLALAIEQFDQANSCYPASRTFLNDASYKASGNMPTNWNTSSARTQTLSWVHQIMPYIEKQDMLDAVEANLKASPPGYVWDVFGKISMAVCPTDRSEQPYSSNTSSKGAKIKHSKLSYGINGGVWDNTSMAYPQAGFDWEQNGIAETRLRGASDPLLQFQKLTKGRVTDGTTNTVLLGENIDLEEWNDPATEISVAILWDDNFNADGTYAGSQFLNGYPKSLNPPDTKPDTLLNLYAQGQSVGISYARPLSNHPTGFMLAFCDGHVKFVSESIDRLVYFRLMTSSGKKYLPAGTPPANVANPQLMQAIRQIQMQPLSDDSY